MTQQEALAYLYGFTSGAIFFACSAGTFQLRAEVMEKTKRELHQAQARAALKPGET